MKNEANPTAELTRLIKAKYTLIWIKTEEERRAERAVSTCLRAENYTPLFWDCAEGATDLFGDKVEMMKPGEGGKPVAQDELPPTLPGAVFDAMRARQRREGWIMRDLHPHLDDPVVVRGLKNLARDLQMACEDDPENPQPLGVLVVVTSSGEIPVELRSCAAVIDWPLPSRGELRKILEGALAMRRGSVKGEPSDAVEAAAGLTAEDAAGAFALSLVDGNVIDPAVIASAKKRIIERERVLTWWPPDERGLDAIGGLELLKGWVVGKAECFKPGAREFGLDAPRGVLLAGVSGCGKSSTTKAIPAILGDYPLLRLDMGSLKGSLMGQSEENIRRALRLADAMGRVVLWIDEVGKALAGATRAQGGDSGVAADALGELLFWMEEHEGESLVVATTNEVDLPPEFCQRFDATFFIDLPTQAERVAIFEVLLKQLGRDPGAFDLDAAAARTNQFSGREIKKVIQSALLLAWGDDKRDLATEDLIEAAAAIVPTSSSSQEHVSSLRAWAKGRALPASMPEAAKPVPTSQSAGGDELSRFRS